LVHIYTVRKELPTRACSTQFGSKMRRRMW
jgi:hypothetical protein